MLDIIAYIKGFSKAGSFIYDALSNHANSVEQIAVGLESIKVEIHELTNSLKQISNSISEIPAAMRYMQVHGVELEAMGYIIRASEALECGVIDDAQSQLERAKALYPSNWPLWVGFVWLDILKNRDGKDHDARHSDSNDGAENRNLSLEKAIKYVKGDRRIHGIYKLRLLFLLYGVARFYNDNGSCLLGLKSISGILEEAGPIGYVKLKKMIQPLQSEIRLIGNDSIQCSYQGLLDAAFDDLIIKKKKYILEIGMDRFSLGWEEAEMIISLGAGVVSPSMLDKAKDLKTRLYNGAVNAIESAIRQSVAEKSIHKKAETLLQKIDVIHNKAEDIDLDTMQINKPTAMKKLIGDEVVRYFISEVTSEDRWKPDKIASILKKISEIKKLDRNIFPNPAAEYVKALEKKIEFLAEEHIAKLVPLSDARNNLEEKLYALNTSSGAVGKITGLLTIIYELVSGSGAFLLSILVGAVVYLVVLLVLAGVFDLNVLAAIIGIPLALVAGYFSFDFLSILLDSMIEFIDDKIISNFFQLKNKKKIESLKRELAVIEEQEEKIQKEIGRYAKSITLESLN